jgi:UDP-GlcNAc:undecaprenyl-phosphate GlcNAc-1-phosphate transferase
MTAVLIAFTFALLASLGLTVPVRQLALRVGMVDHPGPRKVHLTPIPLLGGLAIYCGVVLAILVAIDGEAWGQMVGILSGATLVALVGVLDDRGLLHHQIKLFVGMPAAAIILLASGVRAQVFSAILGGQAGRVADAALTILWVVGITAAFSIFDHMDGLCAGVAAMAALFFTIFATLSGQVLVSTLAAAVLGAALGFLRWNFNPAKIFMGDGGAMFLGFLMATLALKLRPSEPPHANSWLIPVLILGVPIFDTTLVSISRSRRGLLPFTSPGKDHTAHRLANLGLGQRRAVLALYALGAVFGLVALVVKQLPARQSYALAGAIAAAMLVAVALLERAPFERQEPKKIT